MCFGHHLRLRLQTWHVAKKHEGEEAVAVAVAVGSSMQQSLLCAASFLWELCAAPAGRQQPQYTPRGDLVA